MKNIHLLLTFICMSVFSSYSQETRFEYVYPDNSEFSNAGKNLIKFHNGTFQTALKKAERENKFLFLDFYAEWCGPCKQIEKEVFSDREFAKYINDNYIAYKIHTDDLSKDGGSDLAMKLDVYELPVLMAIDYKQNKLGKVTGYKTATSFLVEFKQIERYASYKR